MKYRDIGIFRYPCIGFYLRDWKKLYIMVSDESAYIERKILLGAALILCLLALSAYSNTLYAPFVLDDIHSFVAEPKVLGFTYDLIGLKKLATSSFGVRRFLPMLTFALDTKWGNESLIAFHLTNIIIHILATFSLLFLLQSLHLFPKAKLSYQVGEKKFLPVIIVVTVVGLWSLSPIQTNAVTYIVQRMTSIATLFYFLSFGSYLRGRNFHLTKGFSNKSLFLYLLSLICFILAMMSKEIAATLPVMVLLFEWLLVDNSGLFVTLKKHRLFISCLIVLFLSVLGYKLYNGWLLGGYSGRHFTLVERLLTQLRIVVSYCGVLLLPLPRWLNLEHDVVLSTSLFSPMSTFFSLIFIVLVVFFAWRVRSKKPLITFGICWFFVNLLIESTVIPLELKFEHRLYLPSAGFYLVVVLFVREICLRFNGDDFSLDSVKLFACVAIIVCSGLSFLTYTRNVVWADTVSLYQDCISKAPNKARPYSNLATAWLDKGEYESALQEAQKSISLGIKGYEEYWVASCDIISSLSRMNRFQEAVSQGESLLRRSPKGAKKNSYPLFLYDLGQAYVSKKDFQSAFNYFVKGYKIAYENDLPLKLNFEIAMAGTLKVGLLQGYQFSPGLSINQKNPDVAVEETLAQVFFKLNNLDLARKYVEQTFAKDKNSMLALNLKKAIGQIVEANGKQKSIGTLKEKYLFHPFSSKFNFFMAVCILLEKNSFSENAILQYSLRQVETLDVTAPDVYIVKSWYYYRLKKYDKALEVINYGLKLQPDYAQLWVNRGIYALAAKNDNEAQVSLKKALQLYPNHPHRKKILVMQKLANKMLDQNKVVDFNDSL